MQWQKLQKRLFLTIAGLILVLYGQQQQSSRYTTMEHLVHMRNTCSLQWFFESSVVCMPFAYIMFSYQEVIILLSSFLVGQ